MSNDASNRPPDPTEDCAGPWFTKSGSRTLSGPSDRWLCETCGSDCPEPSKWEGAKITLLASVKVGEK